jgi:hypothetical protein
MPFDIIFWSRLLTHAHYVLVIWYDCEPLTIILCLYEISCLNHEHNLFHQKRINNNPNKNYGSKNSHMYYYCCIECLYMMCILVCTTLQENARGSLVMHLTKNKFMVRSLFFY